MSIRLRLTLLYSAILALILIVFGAVVYDVASQATLGAAKDQLVADTNILRRYTQQSTDMGELYLQIREPDGTVFGRSPNLKRSGGTLPLSPPALSQLEQLPPGQSPPAPSIVTVAGQQVLLYSIPLRGDPLSPPSILQVARPMQFVNQPLDTVRDVLLGAGAVGILLACAAGWLLAGAALRPIKRITQTAQAIGEAKDFSRRVKHTGPQDEVGRLATTFNTMLGRLQDAYQAQRRFVADASHELRTPLTSIRGNLGLLQRQPPISSADREAVLTDLVRESERMSRLVADLLTLARADTGRQPRREPVAVAPLLADLLRRLRTLHPDRAIHDESGGEALVLGDRDALTQVLLILLDNALKFTPVGGSIAVTTALTGQGASIAVRDSGCGIAPDALPHIFERFYQADSSRTGSGTGLGLAIAKALVEGQGGTLAVQSQVGAGSAFTVTLPQAAQAVEPLPAPDPSAPTPSTPLALSGS